MIRTLKIVGIVGGVILVLVFLFLAVGWAGLLALACVLLAGFTTSGNDVL
jgi:hypothetical protein